MQRHTALKLCSVVAGKPVTGGGLLVIRSPYDGAEAGSVTLAARGDVEAAVAAAVQFRDTPNRFQRSEILDKARRAVETDREDFARLITAESGLAIREARYEVGRALDVLRL